MSFCLWPVMLNTLHGQKVLSHTSLNSDVFSPECMNVVHICMKASC